jgi:large subunit ribosomal protein L1
MNIELEKGEQAGSLTLSEALSTVLSNAQVKKRKFDESIEIIINCILEKDESLRGSIALPNNLGKTKKIIVFLPADKSSQEDALIKAGADRVGYDDLISEIDSGKIDQNAIYMTSVPYMAGLKKIASKLGAKGLMPNAKVGTLLENIEGAIHNMKHKVAFYKSGKTGMIQSRIGTSSMNADQLCENISAFVKQILGNVKNPNPKNAVKSIYVKSTMTKAIRISDLSFIQ